MDQPLQTLGWLRHILCNTLGGNLREGWKCERVCKNNWQGLYPRRPCLSSGADLATVTHFLLMSYIPVWVLSFFEVARHIYGTLTHFLAQTSRTYVRVVTFHIPYGNSIVNCIRLRISYSQNLVRYSTVRAHYVQSLINYVFRLVLKWHHVLLIVSNLHCKSISC